MLSSEPLLLFWYWSIVLSYYFFSLLAIFFLAYDNKIFESAANNNVLNLYAMN